MLPVLFRIAAAAARTNLRTNPREIKDMLVRSDNMISNARQYTKYKNDRKELSRLSSIANKRKRRLEKSGLHTVSSAYTKAFKDVPEQFGVQGLQGPDEVMREMDRVKTFLRNEEKTKVSSLKKWLDNLAKKEGVNIPKDGYADYAGKFSNTIRAFNRLKQMRPELGSNLNSDSELASVSSMVEEFGDFDAYGEDDLDAMVELLVEEYDKKRISEGKRKKINTTPRVFSTNKAPITDDGWD